MTLTMHCTRIDITTVKTYTHVSMYAVQVTRPKIPCTLCKQTNNIKNNIPHIRLV